MTSAGRVHGGRDGSTLGGPLAASGGARSGAVLAVSALRSRRGAIARAAPRLAPVQFAGARKVALAVDHVRGSPPGDRVDRALAHIRTEADAEERRAD